MKKQIMLGVAVALVFQMSAANTTLEPSDIPTAKERDLLYVIMQNHDVLLTDARHCDGMGFIDDTKTIGQYFSNFWASHIKGAAYYKKGTGKQWISIRTRKLKNGHTYVLILVMQNDGNDVLSQGISFEMDSDKNVKRDSFACAGSG